MYNSWVGLRSVFFANIHRDIMGHFMGTRSISLAQHFFSQWLSLEISGVSQSSKVFPPEIDDPFQRPSFTPITHVAELVVRLLHCLASRGALAEHQSNISGGVPRHQLDQTNSANQKAATFMSQTVYCHCALDSRVCFPQWQYQELLNTGQRLKQKVQLIPATKEAAFLALEVLVNSGACEPGFL